MSKLHIHFIAGIAAGQISMLFVGNQDFCHYITMGRAVGAVNGAEHYCVSGDTVVAPSAWCFVNANDYVFEYCDDNKHAKVSCKAFFALYYRVDW